MNQKQTFAGARTVRDIAREYLDNAGGITAVAIANLKAAIRNDDALLDLIATEAVMPWAAIAVQDEMRADRAAIWHNARNRAQIEERRAALPQKGQTTAPKTQVASLSNGLRDSLMNFPLAGGQRLRDATKEEVAQQAALYRGQSHALRVRAVWLSKIEASLAPGQKVGDALTEADVVALQNEAQTNA